MASIVKVDQIQNADGTVEYLNAGSIKNASLHSSVTGGSGITALGTVASAGAITTSNPINFTGPNHTFTVKALNQPITDSQTGTTPDVANSTSDQLAIYNGSTKLWGINEDGYVVNPNRPMFQAYANFTSGTLNERFSGTYGEFTGIYKNIGNHYDGTKFFTAPITGYYQFHSNIMTGSADGYGLYQYKVNGAVYLPSGAWYQGYQYATGNDKIITANPVIYLSAGDYVGIFINDSHDHFYWGSTYSYWGGYLLG